MTSTVYAEMTQEQLDWAYNNREQVPDHPAVLEALMARGEAYIAEAPHMLDIPFGASAAETLDVYPATGDHDGPRPVLIFFHGGYWFSRHKDDFRVVPSGFCPGGAVTVVVNYALIPSVDMAELVRQCRAAVAWTHAHIAEYGGDPNRLYISGHSAGGHLTAMMFATDWQGAWHVPNDAIKGGVAVSGIYDLEPIRLCYMNETLGFTPDTVRDFSPVRLEPVVAAPLIYAVGGAETAEFLRQNTLLDPLWRGRGVDGTETEIAGANHFTVLRAFTAPGSDLNRRTLEMMGLA